MNATRREETATAWPQQRREEKNQQQHRQLREVEILTILPVSTRPGDLSPDWNEQSVIDSARILMLPPHYTALLGQLPAVLFANLPSPLYIHLE